MVSGERKTCRLFWCLIVLIMPHLLMTNMIVCKRKTWNYSNMNEQILIMITLVLRPEVQKNLKTFIDPTFEESFGCVLQLVWRLVLPQSDASQGHSRTIAVGKTILRKCYQSSSTGQLAFFSKILRIINLEKLCFHMIGKNKFSSTIMNINKIFLGWYFIFTIDLF